MEKQSKCKKVGDLLLLFFTALAGISATGIWLLPGCDPFGVKKGKLEERKPLSAQTVPGLTLVSAQAEHGRYAPYGNELPTIVSFTNSGGGECQIRGAEFQITRERKTPKRDDLSGYQPRISKLRLRKSTTSRNNKAVSRFSN
jgi:hypothetical protein